MAALLIATMTVSTIQLFMLAVLASTLIDEFGISRSQIGWLGAANTAVGALAAPTFGKLTDRVGARQSLIAIGLLSGLGLFVTAAAPTYLVLLAGSAVCGVPQGWSNSATNKVIAEQLPAGERGTITGLKQSGVQLAIFLAGIALPVGSQQIGWRLSVASFGAFGLVVAFAGSRLLSYARPPLTRSESSSATAHSPTSTRLPSLVYRIAVYAVIMGLAGGVISRFLPLFAQERLGFSESRAGLVVALGGLLGMAARIFWGKLADGRVDPRFALAILAAGSVATAVLLLASERIGGWTLWLVAVGLAFFFGAWNVVAMLAVMTLVPANQAGRGTGIVMLFFLTGVAASGPLAGWSIDSLGSYRPAWVAAIALAALAILTMIQRSDSTDGQIAGDAASLSKRTAP